MTERTPEERRPHPRDEEEGSEVEGHLYRGPSEDVFYGDERRPHPRDEDEDEGEAGRQG